MVTRIETQVSNLSISNSTSGGTFIANTGALSLTSLDGITAFTSAGGLTISAASPITISTSIIQAGTIDLTAGETGAAGDDLTVNAGVTVQATAGNVNLRAGDHVIVNGTTGSPTLVQSDLGTVLLQAAFSDTDSSGSVQLAGTGTGNMVIIAAPDAAGVATLSGRAITSTANSLVSADTINLAASAGSIGAVGAPVRVQSTAGTASPTVTATLSQAIAGLDIAIEQAVGPLTTASYALVTDAGTVQDVFLSTTNGSLTVDGPDNGFAAASSGHTNDNLTLTAAAPATRFRSPAPWPPAATSRLPRIR